MRVRDGCDVGSAHHGDLDALVAQHCDSSGPLAIDEVLAFELETEFMKEADRRGEVFDDDAVIVHSHSHATTLPTDKK